ncbi:MAG: hypothetical protein UIC63_10380 [Bacteroidaceae bacterium]|nr:hypothetical protein [Bacteroidaceae bacterium]
MIIIETKTNVHIFKDREVDHVEYNRELSNVLLYFMAEGLLDEKKTVAFDDVLDVRYITDACPKAYEYKSTEQARLLRELEERRNLDTLNQRIIMYMKGLYCFVKEGNSNAEEAHNESICKMLEERREIYNRIDEIGKCKETINNGKLL